ncbi:hypothetical protein [Moheibacter sediminis]|uniref:Uncharacterized protein n=1 Tax=Moheibacter sediminis TaxID=1434700 RepID=A0A1W2C0X5_9FLAO|nr:hypothetical protein [Moheibacter sediminis]SMC78839.1 hypothetical protein SAMN06296427_10847 [Moheibacter sediminis]
MKKVLPLLLFSWLFVMFSCKEDDLETRGHEHAEHSMKKNKVSFQKMKSYLLYHTDSSLPAYFEPAYSRGNDAFVTAVDTTSIVQIVSGDITTFTLHVNTLDDELYAYSNLVIRLEEGKITESILHYNPTADWQTAYNRGERLPYEGDLTVTDINGEARGTGGAGCMLEIQIACYGGSCPCTDGNGQTIYVQISCGGGGSDPGDGNPTDPNPGGYDPSEGGGGGNNNGAHNSCQFLKNKLTEPLQNGQNFKTRLQELKPKVFNSPDEWGYINQNPSEDPNVSSGATNQYNPAKATTIPDGRKAVKLDISGPHIFGYMHTHPNNESTAGIPSMEDIIEFLRMVKYRYQSGLPTNNTYSIVVGNHGVYAITIDNIDDFISGYGSFSRELMKDFVQRFENNYYDKVKNRPLSENDRPNNEKALLKFLNTIKFDTGIGVYRANDNLTGWDKLQLNASGQVQPTNCN